MSGGSPTEQSDLDRYLDIPCASIEAETASSFIDGDWGALYTLRSSYWTLSPIVHLIAGESLERAAESEKDSVLLTAHFDSWGPGAVDNLSGVAVIVGIMEKASQMGSALPRRLDAFIWSGHSHGRYAGSAAWIDHHFAWASQHALLNINVDCLGANNSEITGRLPFSPAAHELARAALAHCAPGVALSRVPLTRSCDQSFFAAGIPTLFSNVSEVVPQEGEEAFAAPGLNPIYGPHWHTEDDDLRAVDEERLKRDAALVARGAALAVACGAERLSAWREFDALFSDIELHGEEAVAQLRKTLERTACAFPIHSEGMGGVKQARRACGDFV